MKILVFGGTGAMGEYLVKVLSENPSNSIYVTSRVLRNNYDNVTFIQGNAHDDDFFKRILEKESWDVLVDFMVYTTQEFHIRLNTILESVGHYIFLSTCRVFASSDAKINENTPRLLDTSTDNAFLLSDDYPITKARQENLIFESNNTNWTIVRPYITYSSHRLQLGVYEKEYWLSRALYGGTVEFSKKISDSITTLTYGGDVARGLALLVGNKKALGQSVNITTSECLLWKDILDIYKTTYRMIKGKEMRVLLCEDANVDAIAISSVWPVKYDRFYNRVFDNSKFLAIAGNNFSFAKCETALQQCFAEFLEKQYEFKEIPTSIMAYLDRITGDRNSSPKSIKDYAKYIVIRETDLFRKKTVWKMHSIGQELI